MKDDDHDFPVSGERGPGIADPGTVTVWQPVTQGELDLVAASRWRAWPSRLPGRQPFIAVFDRRYATAICREQIVPAEGVGYVVRYVVKSSFLNRYEVHDERQVLIPAENVADLNAHIIGAIREVADFRGPVDGREFAEAEKALGRPLPAAWRDYLQGESWFRRGWMAGGAYVWLNTPLEMLELHGAWDEATSAHPGIAIIGGDGSREQLVLDLREEPSPVVLVDITSDGWGSAIRQADDVAQLIRRVENEEFEFTFGDEQGLGT